MPTTACLPCCSRAQCAAASAAPYIRRGTAYCATDQRRDTGSGGRPEHDAVARPDFQSDAVGRPVFIAVATFQSYAVIRFQSSPVARSKSNANARPKSAAVARPGLGAVASHESNSVARLDSSAVARPEPNAVAGCGCTTVTVAAPASNCGPHGAAACISLSMSLHPLEHAGLLRHETEQTVVSWLASDTKYGSSYRALCYAVLAARKSQVQNKADPRQAVCPTLKR